MCACDGIDQVRGKRLTYPAAPGDCTRPGVAHTPADAMGRAEDTPLSRLFCNNQKNCVCVLFIERYRRGHLQFQARGSC